MTRFNTTIAAGVLAGLGLIYMVASLATGRSARAEAPPDLRVDSSRIGVDVWQATDLLIRDKGGLAVIDIRSPVEHARYHLPGSQNEPDASASRIVELAGTKKIILVASKDDQASALATSARSSSGRKDIFYLKGGAPSFFLKFELPIPLFSEKDVPFGYEEALAVVKAHLEGRGKEELEHVQDALATLVRLGYEPTALKKTGKTKAAVKKRKKISGGCQ
ncbi:MAG: rhodanese-like domain-containing protein [Deltaproteobacteria bacterium]|nr:rhodanese-like domain-containing protein [Deltaproteobacteria bacterium]